MSAFEQLRQQILTWRNRMNQEANALLDAITQVATSPQAPSTTVTALSAVPSVQQPQQPPAPIFTVASSPALLTQPVASPSQQVPIVTTTPLPTPTVATVIPVTPPIMATTPLVTSVQSAPLSTQVISSLVPSTVSSSSIHLLQQQQDDLQQLTEIPSAQYIDRLLQTRVLILPAEPVIVTEQSILSFIDFIRKLLYRADITGDGSYNYRAFLVAVQIVLRDMLMYAQRTNAWPAIEQIAQTFQFELEQRKSRIDITAEPPVIQYLKWSQDISNMQGIGEYLLRLTFIHGYLSHLRYRVPLRSPERKIYTQALNQVSQTIDRVRDVLSQSGTQYP